MRSIGRRKADKYRVLAGILLGAVLTSYAMYVQSCGGGSSTTVTGKTSDSQDTASASAPVPTPAPTATPRLIALPPGAHEGREVSWGSFSSGTIKNTSDQKQHYDFCAKRPDLSNIKTGSADVGAGASFAFDLGVGCNQTDITQNGCGPTFLPIEAAWYGLDGRYVNTATQVDWKACYPDCRPEWRELEEVRIVGEWTDFVPESSPASVTQVCYKWQRRLVIRREQNSCDQTVRDKGEAYYETRKVEIECPCVNVQTTRTVTTYGTWTNVVGQCGTRKKTVTTYTLNSCTHQETSTETTSEETKDCPLCYYRVSCGVSQSTGDHSCTDQAQQTICQTTIGGVPPKAGIWRNFGPQNLQNHCQFVVPGVSLDNFQLNPGQSDKACFNKKDDE